MSPCRRANRAGRGRGNSNTEAPSRTLPLRIGSIVSNTKKTKQGEQAEPARPVGHFLRETSLEDLENGFAHGKRDGGGHEIGHDNDNRSRLPHGLTVGPLVAVQERGAGAGCQGQGRRSARPLQP